MATIRSYTNAFEVTDYTQELQIVPNSWTLLNDSGLFTEEFLSTNTVTFEEQAQTLGLIGDAFRGAKPQANKDDNRKIRSYPIAHFPIVDAVKPEDIQGKRAYGSNDTAETEAAVIARKMERIRRNMDITMEVGRFSLLTTGNLYAPNGTISGNVFTDFGITQTSVDFVLGTTTTDIVAKVETVIAAMQDNANTGDVITGIIAYCSPEWFAKLIAHTKIVDAYKYFSATEGQMIQRNRAGGNNGLYREFTYAGIRFIEVRTVLAGQRLIPAGEVVFVPTGTTDTFVSYFGPANRMDFVNTVAERGYMWSYRDPKGQGIDIDGEFNVTSIVRRPALVVKGTTSN
jgi:Phage major capsid protein E